MARLDQLNETFGKVLRTHRLNADFSQEDLAFECGLDRTYISMLERGKRQPTIRTVFLISDALSVSPAKLIGAVDKEIG